MNYICYKQFNNKSISGIMSISVGALCDMTDNVIYYNDLPVCYATSSNGHQYFTRNDDLQGAYRGELLTDILDKLSDNTVVRIDIIIDENGEEREMPVTKSDLRWDAVMADELCLTYLTDTRWNHEFYIAPISDLEHIDGLLDIE